MRPLLYAVSDNFLDVTFREYFVVTEAAGISAQEPIRALASVAVNESTPIVSYPVNALSGVNAKPQLLRTIDAIAPEGIRSTLSVSPGRDAYLFTSAIDSTVSPRPTWSGYWYLNPKVMASKVPGFFFSSLPIIAARATYIVSMNTYQVADAVMTPRRWLTLCRAS